VAGPATRRPGIVPLEAIRRALPDNVRSEWARHPPPVCFDANGTPRPRTAPWSCTTAKTNAGWRPHLATTKLEGGFAAVSFGSCTPGEDVEDGAALLARDGDAWRVVSFDRRRERDACVRQRLRRRAGVRRVARRRRRRLSRSRPHVAALRTARDVCCVD
jgi:hypothetical protein